MRSISRLLAWLYRPVPLAACIVLGAAALRLGFLVESQAIPMIRTPPPTVDIDVYWNAARELRRAAAEDPSIPNLELMICSAPFHVYFLAGLQALFGESMFVIRCVVAALSCLRFPLVFWLALRLSQRLWAAALVTALLAALPSLIYFDTVLLKTSTHITLLTVLFFCLLFRPPESDGRRLLRGAAAGLVLALCYLNQLNTVLYLFVFAAYVARIPGLSVRAELLYALPALAIFAMAFFGFQLMLKGNMIPHSGVNLLLGFNEGAAPTYRPLPLVPPAAHGHAFLARLAAETATERRMTPAESDAHYMGQALAFVREHPGSAFWLLWNRALVAVNNYEVKAGDHLPWLQWRSRSLRLPPSNYGILFVLGCCGIPALLSARRFDLVVLFAGTLLAVILANGLTFVNFRFRAPAVIPLCMLASAGLPFLADRLRALLSPSGWRLDRTLVTLSLVVLAASWLTFRSISLLGPTMRGGGQVAAGDNRFSLASERRLEELRRLDDGGELSLARRGIRASILSQLGRHTEAYRAAREVVEETVENRDASLLTLRYLLWLGRYQQARALAARLRQHDEDLVDELTYRLHPLEQAVFALFVSPREP
jgi:hypothetical protein